MTDRDLQQKRYLAAGIDIAVFIAVGIVFMVVGGVLGFAFSSATSTSMVGVYLPRVISFLWSLVCLGYILGRDIVAGDRSIGKKLQNIRVVTVKGAPIGPLESAKRNGIFAIGAVLGVLSATLGLVPCLGDVVRCLLLPVLMLGMLVGLAAAIYELIQITQRADGVRYGDQIAGTRVVR
jgi:flagellar biosynthesis protein FliQ